MKKTFLLSALLCSTLFNTNSFAQVWTGSSVSTHTTGNINSDANIHATNGEVKGYNIWGTNFILSNGDIQSDANIRAVNGEVKGYNLLGTNLIQSNGDIAADANIRALNGQMKAYDIWGTNLILSSGDIQADANIRAVNGEIKGLNVWATNLLKSSGDIQAAGSIYGDANIHALNGEIKGLNVWATNLLKSSGDLQVTGKIIVGNPLPSTPAGYKLYVKDGILTEKIKVALSSDPANWSDFVFAENYTLRTLDEVEEYIKENKHLPEIPSTAEVHKNGLDLAQMDAKLLQKVEELTLYIIQQQKRIEQLEEKLNK